jgi:hypothetical protein
VMATCSGVRPTGMTVKTVLLAGLITDTFAEPAFVT